MNRRKVSVITVHYNAPAMTRRLLRSLQQIEGDYEVIVVDNGSAPVHSARLWADEFPQVRFVYSDENLGFAGGNALALPHAQGRYLFFLNNDAFPDSQTISRLVQFLDGHPRAGAVSPLILARGQNGRPAQVLYAGKTALHPLTGRNRTLRRGTTAWHLWQDPFRTAYVHGAAMMVRREVIDQVGFMDERFFLYYEELDWAERMRSVGWELWVEPRAHVWHDESYTIGPQSGLKVFFQTRNRWYFMWRNRPTWAFAAFAAWFFAVVIPKQWLAFARKGYGVQRRAVIDALRWVLGSQANRRRIDARWKAAASNGVNV